MTVIGWDIGGVNTKAARVHERRDRSPRATSRSRSSARPPPSPARLEGIASELGAEKSDAHAITMTAELSQFFRTKRDGVAYVLDAVEHAFPDSRDARLHGRWSVPRSASARNVATSGRGVELGRHRCAQLATLISDAILIDVGTTTTDIIPISGGRVVAIGHTDPERLLSGELLYLGAVRTPVEAIVHRVPLHDGLAGVSAEAFALSGDIHVWRGDLAPEGYTAPTPDNSPRRRATSRASASRASSAPIASCSTSRTSIASPPSSRTR